MTDHELEQRLRRWYATEIGDETASVSLYHRVTALPEATRVQPGYWAWRSRVILLAAAALLVALIAGAVAVGSGVVKLPAVLPDPSASPTVQATPTATPAVAPWLTGQELVDVLSEQFGYEWQISDYGNGITRYATDVANSNTQVGRPFKGLANVFIGVGLEGIPGEGSQHVGRIAQLLAPDAAAWVAETLEQAAAAEGSAGDFSQTTQTANGGYVRIALAREEVLRDWVAVEFSPEIFDSPEPVDSVLPDLDLPGTSPNEPAGIYGWTGRLGETGGMHRDGEAGRTHLIFKVLNDCFGPGSQDSVPVTVAGLDALYLEPIEPARTYGSPQGDETTGAYALPIGDRTLCVYATWDPETTQDELDELRQVVESIRGQTVGEDSILINFRLPAGWDTG